MTEPREHGFPVRADGVLVPEGYPRAPSGLGATGLAGVPRARACTQGLPRNLGGLDISTERNGSRAGRNPRKPGRVAPSLHCQATPRGTAKRRNTKCGGMGGEESERAVVPLKVGDPKPRGPAGGKGELDTWTRFTDR